MEVMPNTAGSTRALAEADGSKRPKLKSAELMNMMPGDLSSRRVSIRWISIVVALLLVAVSSEAFASIDRAAETAAQDLRQLFKLMDRVTTHPSAAV